MIISFRGKKDIPARVLPDCRCTTPIASKQLIEEHNVALVTHKEQKELQNFAKDTVQDCGWCYNFPLTCQHGEHYSKETFEIGPMEYSCDLMLPYWCIVKHKAKGFTAGGIIHFESEECKLICAWHNCNSSIIEIDDTILDFGNNPQWIRIIGNLEINDRDEIDIDWIDRILWQYWDYKSLYNGDVSNVCHLTDHLTMPLSSNQERNPLGHLSILSRKKSYQYSRNISKTCLTRERSTQVSQQQVHQSSSFQSLIGQAYHWA